MSGKRKFTIHDRKQHWSIYDHESLPLECLLMPNIVRVKKFTWIYKLRPTSFGTKVY
jgi:hypothetical protein